MSGLGRNGRWVQRWVLRGRILSLRVQVNIPLPTPSDYRGSFPTEGMGPWWVVGFTRAHPMVFSRLRDPGLASPTHTHKHQVGLPPPTALFSSLCHKPGATVEVRGWVVPPQHGDFRGQGHHLLLSTFWGLQTSVPGTQPGDKGVQGFWTRTKMASRARVSMGAWALSRRTPPSPGLCRLLPTGHPDDLQCSQGAGSAI